MSKRKLKGQLNLFDIELVNGEENLPKKFSQCKKCWCYDCKHNRYNEGVPRDLCGNKIPCPACDECVKQGFADVCEINSAKNGCSLRAEEEGIDLKQ